MEGDGFDSLVGMLESQNVSSMPSQPIGDEQESVFASPSGTPLGLDPGAEFDLDTVQSCAIETDVHVDTHKLQQLAEPPFSRADVNKALFEARLQCLDDTELKYPWETGVMGEIFSDSNEVVGLPKLPAEYLGIPGQLQSSSAAAAPSTASQKVTGRDLELPYYSLAIRVKPDRDIFAEQEVLWTRAIGKWLQVFEVLGFPGQLGAALDIELHFSDAAEHGAVLRDALGVKSPRTAMKRAQALLQYFNWLHLNYVDWDPWDRSRCLAYLSSSDSHTPAASVDPQLKGRAQRLMPTKAEYRQARPLKAKEVSMLERLMVGQLDVVDKYMLGAVLFSIFSRSRWSDLQHIHRLWVDRDEFEGQAFGFVETETAFHKSVTSLKKKMRFMPIVCPILGITDTDWTAVWLERFELLQVDTDACPFGPICRAPGSDGLLCKRSCTSTEISEFLNRILKTSDGDKVSSHSLKHTTLNWASFYGIDEQSRTLLGHHELQGSKAMAVYSRDMLTRPLQLYCSMLANIRGDHFRPDESRTSRMLDLMRIQKNQTEVSQAAPAVVPTPAPARPRLDVDDDAVPTTPLDDVASMASGRKKDDEAGSDDDSESLRSTSSSSSDDDDEAPSGAVAMVDYIEGPVLRNRKSHVVHKLSSMAGRTLCNRITSESTFETLMEGCSTLNARCSRCFKGQVLTTPSAMADAFDEAKAKRFKRI
eukprot:s673_g25.t1